MSNIIRFAQTQDKLTILELQRKIYKEAGLDSIGPFIEEDTLDSIQQFIDTEQLLVIEVDNYVVGCIGFTLQRATFNFSILLAAEIGWSIKEGYEEYSISMFEKLIEHCTNLGVNKFKTFIPFTLPQLEKHYKRLGFKKIEETWIKEI